MSLTCSTGAIYHCTFQQIPKRPPTAKPKDPDSYHFDDPDLERDYRKMYETIQELEQKANEKNESDDPNSVRKAMEAALIFGGAK